MTNATVRNAATDRGGESTINGFIAIDRKQRLSLVDAAGRN